MTTPRKTSRKKASRKKAGRPKGKKTAKREQAIVEKSRCPKCKSTSRTKYIGMPYVMQITGVRHGLRYTRVVRRKTQCKNCGQHRFDLTYELPAQDQSGPKARTRIIGNESLHPAGRAKEKTAGH